MVLDLGRRLGPYEILSPLGEGGMGEVYRARDTRLERDVAIKVLPENLARDGSSLNQFEIEAKILASLSHPNILSIHDFRKEDGIHFAVTELLRGETVRGLVQRGPVMPSKAIRIGVAIAEGLSAAHSRGIVHRDLKPENVFLTEDGGVKILDFGLALSGTIEASDETRETISGSVVGTVNYMSPEQARGETLDARTDLYSLGCILYEMVTQKPPHARKTAADTLAAILKEDVSEDDEGLTKASPELAVLIRSCLEKKRANRIQSARDLALALRLLSSASQTVQLSSAFPQLRRPRRWHVAAIPILAAVIGITAYAIFPRSTDSIHSVAVLPFINEGREQEIEYLCDGLTESLINNLSQAPGLRVMAQSTVFHYKGKQSDPRQIGKELHVGAILTGRVAVRGGALLIRAELVDLSDGSQLWGQQYTRQAADILALQGEISKEISEALRLRLSGAEQRRVTRHYTDDREAFQLYLKGRYSWNKRTPEELARGIAFFERAIENDPGFALAYAGLADSYIVLGGYGFMNPRDAFPKAKAAAQNALAIDNALAEAWTPLALASSSHDWDWTRAESEFRRSLDLNPNHPTTHHWYAIFLVSVGRIREGLAEIEKAEELDPLSMIINTDHGLLLRIARQEQAAIDQLKKTITMDPSFPLAHAELRVVYEEKGLFEQAIGEIEQSAAVSNADPHSIRELREAYIRDGGRGYWETLLKAARNRSEDASPATAFELAYLVLQLGQKDDAMRYLEQAYAERTPGLTWIKVDPRFDQLRGDPRFLRLIEAMRFPP